MKMRNDMEVKPKILSSSLKRITNQIYKLLPLREEKKDWQKPLETLIEELSGLYGLMIEENEKQVLFSLICKLQGLFNYSEENQFDVFRRVIFDCLGLINEVVRNV